MRFWILGLFVSFCASNLAHGADVPAFNTQRRVPLTTSRVIGSPEPPPPYRAVRAYESLETSQPIGVYHEPGTQNLLLIQQLKAAVGAGRIARLSGSEDDVKSEVLLDSNHTIYGIAFHPKFLENGYIFVGSNGPVTDKPDDKDNKVTRVSRFTIDREAPFACDPKSQQIIIEWASNGHNGGDLAFGKDGMLYVSSGDGTSDSDTDLAGQDMTRLLAKVLRIDVEHPAEGQAYSVPPDNPFVGQEGIRPETWAAGFRNPWRLHIDRKTGDLWIGNNGQDLWEQAYLVERGANYGWSVMEGSHPFYLDREAGPQPFSKPIAEHHHSEARSLTGGVVYYGKKLPDLVGAYIYGDYSTGKIWGIRHKRGRMIWHQEIADTTLQITGFGSDPAGELLIVDYTGGLYRLEPRPVSTDPPAKFPRLLSETGLFASVPDNRTMPALIPYTVNAPLWSDGAIKERFIALPQFEHIDFKLNRGWEFPNEAVLVKTFSLPQKTADGEVVKRIETRLLTRQDGEWQGYSYRWNDEQTDAELVDKTGVDAKFLVADATAEDGVREQLWHFPSRAECMVCHSRAANYVLGLSTVQMNREHQYGETKLNQLTLLEQLGAFRIPWTEHLKEMKGRWNKTSRPPHKPKEKPEDKTDGDKKESDKTDETKKDEDPFAWPFADLEKELGETPKYVSLLPKRPEEYPALVDPHDAAADLTERVRSYLHANCASCHTNAGGGNSQINLDFGVKLDKAKLIDEAPLHKLPGFEEAKLVTPHDPAHSVLFARISRRGTGQMPPLASGLVDQQAVELLRQWINELPVESGEPAAGGSE